MTGGLSSDAAGQTSSPSTRSWSATEPVRPAGQAIDKFEAAPLAETVDGADPTTTHPDVPTQQGVLGRPDGLAGSDRPDRPAAPVPPDGPGRPADPADPKPEQPEQPKPEQPEQPEAEQPEPEHPEALDPAAERSDAELLRAHVTGDRDAFATLFHRHRDRLWAVALRTVADREEAADALQDALLSAHRGAARFRGDAAVTTWLHRIVVNACLDRIRRRQSHPTVPLPDSTRPTSTTRWAGGVEPAAPATDHDTTLVVRDALAELPVEQRAALVLVDLQGYPVAEVAKILGVAEGTVKSRCARGRARLAVLLGHLRPTTGTDPAALSGRDTRAASGVPSVTGGNRRPGGGVRSGSTQVGVEDQRVGQDRSRGLPDQDQEES